MITITDTILLLTIVYLAYITRKDSDYKYPTWLLLGEFSIFIGFAAYIHAATIATDIILMLINLIFCAAFILARSTYLAALSGIMALCYSFIILILGSVIDIDYYYGIMLSFAILQLCNIIPRVIDGFRTHRHRVVASSARDDTKHYLIH